MMEVGGIGKGKHLWKAQWDDAEENMKSFGLSHEYACVPVN